MSTTHTVTDQKAANISASTEEVEAYQAALTRFSSHATMGAIHECAEKNGWDVVHFFRDIWRELYDGNFMPWLAEPVRAED
jgi:hypothetical protein